MNRKGTQGAVYPCGSEVAAQCSSVTNKNGYKSVNPARKRIENLFLILLGATAKRELSGHAEVSSVGFRLIKPNTFHRLGLLNGNSSNATLFNTAQPTHAQVSSVCFRLIKPNMLHRLGLLNGNSSNATLFNTAQPTRAQVSSLSDGVVGIDKAKHLLFYQCQVRGISKYQNPVI